LNSTYLPLLVHLSTLLYYLLIAFLVSLRCNNRRVFLVNVGWLLWAPLSSSDLCVLIFIPIILSRLTDDEIPRLFICFFLYSESLLLHVVDFIIIIFFIKGVCWNLVEQLHSLSLICIQAILSWYVCTAIVSWEATLAINMTLTLMPCSSPGEIPVLGFARVHSLQKVLVSDCCIHKGLAVL
jgi:hypothetical protein